MSIFFNKAIAYRFGDVPLFMPAGAMGQDSWRLHEELNKALHSKPARTPGSQELTTFGFAEPYPNAHRSLAEVNEDPGLEDDIDDRPLPRLVRPVNNGEFLVIRAEYQYRNLPGQAVKNELRTRVEAIERSQCRKIYKKERDQIKDEVIQALLPQAFILSRSTYAVIDTQERLIWVNATSHHAAEDLLSTLRECLGSLPVRPVSAKVAPSATFTDWLKTQECYGNFFLLDSVLLEDTHEDGGKVAAIRQDLTSDEIQGIAATGKIATKIAVAYSDKLAFVLTDKLVFSRVRFEDLLQDQAAKDAGEGDVTALHDASYWLMGRTLRDMFTELLAALGGEEVPQGI